MQKQFTLIHWMPTHLPFLWCADRVCVCVCIYYLCDCYGWFMFGYICRQATHWKRQRQRQHHFTCVWLKVFAVFNANMQTTMPAKAWKGPELGMISRRQDRTWPTNKRGPDKQQHSDNSIQKYSRACRENIRTCTCIWIACKRVRTVSTQSSATPILEPVRPECKIFPLSAAQKIIYLHLHGEPELSPSLSSLVGTQAKASTLSWTEVKVQ